MATWSRTSCIFISSFSPLLPLPPLFSFMSFILFILPSFLILLLPPILLFIFVLFFFLSYFLSSPHIPFFFFICCCFCCSPSPSYSSFPSFSCSLPDSFFPFSTSFLLLFFSLVFSSFSFFFFLVFFFSFFLSIFLFFPHLFFFLIYCFVFHHLPFFLFSFIFSFFSAFPYLCFFLFFSSVCISFGLVGDAFPYPPGSVLGKLNGNRSLQLIDRRCHTLSQLSAISWTEESRNDILEATNYLPNPIALSRGHQNPICSISMVVTDARHHFVVLIQGLNAL